ncbi:MAG: hypothetical protein ACLS3M_04875 [Collinsella sp.]
MRPPGAASPLYEPDAHARARARSDKILHHTFDAGEGVLIPAEILEHAKRGCRNFVILQPFGCLPNHVVGRGLIHALKEQYPLAQFLPLDYDPDVSFANVENRLQMLIMNAKAQGCGEAHGETAATPMRPMHAPVSSRRFGSSSRTTASSSCRLAR